MTGYSADEGIKIISYNPKWKIKAAAEISFLHQLIGSNIEIQHFGSTAIPDCCAKDIVDIMIWAENETEIKRLKEILTPIYQGVSSPESQAKGFLCFDKCVEINGMMRRTHHIHIQSDRKKWQRAIAFRDHLIANPADVAKYEEIKRQSSLLAPYDMTKYSELKNDFIDDILAQAE